MSNEFNRQIVIDNILTLTKLYKFKIGDVEKRLGVSAGYLSRLSKKENESALSAEFVFKAARIFGTTIDRLVSKQIEEVDESVVYLQKFIGSLREQTNDGALQWKAIDREEIRNMLQDKANLQFPVLKIKGADFGQPEEVTDEEFSLNPFAIDYSTSHYNDNKVLSCIYGGVAASATNSVYHVSMPAVDSAKELYIASYRVESIAEPVDFFELMLLDKEGYEKYRKSLKSGEEDQVIMEAEIPSFVHEVCNSYANAWLGLIDCMRELYWAIGAREEKIELSDTVKGFIDSFMATI